jgi:lysophospholipase L1-like esterase
MRERQRRHPLILVFLALSLMTLPVRATWAQDTKATRSAVKPVTRDPNWVKRHEGFVATAKKGGVDLLFVGDSITDGWGGEGHNAKAPGTTIFQKEFVPLHAANFGIGGDRTQHVLWRLQNGELDGIKPKVVMLMIGTNNSNGKDNAAAEIADGVTAIVKEIHQRSPTTKVLLLGVFPRANKKTPEENQAQMEKIKQVNALIAKLDDGGKTVRYLDIGDKFLKEDGMLPKDIMPDQLHLSEKGYQIWADAVKGPILDLLGRK